MSAKSMDKYNRWRSKTVGFRVSPEEDALLEAAVSLSGLTKQDYIMRKLTDREVKLLRRSADALKSVISQITY